MSDPGPLTTALLAAAAREVRLADDLADDLEPRLERLVERARSAAPGVEVAAIDFVSHLGARLPADRPLDAALDGVHADELYLACGLARGDRAALRIFEERYLAALPGLLARVERSRAALDDICQTLRERLLVGTNGDPPRILEYAGLGSLLGWLRIAAIRLALNQKRAAPTRSLDEDHLAQEVAPADPELAYLKQRYRAEFAAAFQEALAGLDPRARHILRLRYLDGLNIDRIGALHQVHRATVARWIAGYCRTVQQGARRHLARVLGASPAELSSLERLVESQLEISIRRVLAEPPAADPV